MFLAKAFGGMGGEANEASAMGMELDEEEEDELRREILGEVYAGKPAAVAEEKTEKNLAVDKDDGKAERELFEALRRDALARQEKEGL